MAPDMVFVKDARVSKWNQRKYMNATPNASPPWAISLGRPAREANAAPWRTPTHTGRAHAAEGDALCAVTRDVWSNKTEL